MFTTEIARTVGIIYRHGAYSCMAVIDWRRHQFYFYGAKDARNIGQFKQSLVYNYMYVRKQGPHDSTI